MGDRLTKVNLGTDRRRVCYYEGKSETNRDESYRKD